MAKLAQTSVKYVIKADFDAEGIVERPDVIGALFGQTEGLLGPDLDMRELQRTGRVGRIEVKTESRNGKSKGKIIIPSSLDSAETALIAATLETIDRVGPCDAKINVEKVEDLRSTKRDYIVNRAKNLLSNLIHNLPETATVTEELKQAVRAGEVVNYRGLAAGPDAATSESVTLVEGRADVIVLLKQGIKNVIAIGGTSIPQVVGAISKEKEVTAFLDGDRGGDLILKELKQIAELDFVARAPYGKEVEELTKKEIFKAIRERIPAAQATELKPAATERKEVQMPPRTSGYRTYKKPVAETTYRQTSRVVSRTGVGYRKPSTGTFSKPFSMPRIIRKKQLDEKTKKTFKEQTNELVGTKAASIYGRNMEFSGRVPIKELQKSIKQVTEPFAIILDGCADQNTVRLAEGVGVKYLVCSDNKDRIRSNSIEILTQKDL